MLDQALEWLVKFESDIPCDEMSGSDFCADNCRFDCPQKECWKRFLEEELKNGKHEVSVQ